MNEWAKRRKRIILLIFLGIVLFLGAIPLAIIIYEKPTCFDGRRNGDESGVDCGGSCQLLCLAESIPVISQGDPRVLYIASSTYQVVALFENPNLDGIVRRARYAISLYGKDSTLPVRVIEGETYVPKGSEFTVFQGPLGVGEGEAPVRATFDWSGEFFWEKDTVALPEIRIVERTLTGASSTPRLEAVARNTSLIEARNIELTATLVDSSGNVFAASRTYIDSLSPSEEELAVFTWPRALPAEPVDIRIYTRIYPDPTYLR